MGKKLLKKFLPHTPSSKLSQQFLLCESVHFSCRTLGTADSFQGPLP